MAREGAGLAVVSALRPGGEPPGEDRVRVGTDAVVVLDGASGSGSTVEVGTYVDHLADAVVDVLDAERGVPLRRALAAAIAAVVDVLGLEAGAAPSSTVSIARRRGGDVDLLVLGDSPIHVGPDAERVCDDRLDDLGLPARTRALARLAGGAGHDDVHRELLAALRAEQAARRNRPGGYWIAEALPAAAEHAVVRTVPATTPWVVLATDGVDDPMRHLGLSPADVATASPRGLRDLLDRLHTWEAEHDPHAVDLPRFKRHDDKAMAVVTFPERMDGVATLRR